MTARERYAKCKTLNELYTAYDRDRYGASTWEYLDAIQTAFTENYYRLLKEVKERKEDFPDC